MSAETKDWLVKVVLVVVTVIALICAGRHSVDHADSTDAPALVSLNVRRVAPLLPKLRIDGPSNQES